MTPLIPVSDVDQTQTQLKIANVSDQTHIRHIDRWILPVRYEKATAGPVKIERCQILTPLITVLDVDQTQTQLNIANVSDQTHIRHIDRGILRQIFTPLIPVLDVDQTQTQLKIINVSDQTHIRHIDPGILPVP